MNQYIICNFLRNFKYFFQFFHFIFKFIFPCFNLVYFNTSGIAEQTKKTKQSIKNENHFMQGEDHNNFHILLDSNLTNQTY